MLIMPLVTVVALPLVQVEVILDISSWPAIACDVNLFRTIFTVPETARSEQVQADLCHLAQNTPDDVQQLLDMFNTVTMQQQVSFILAQCFLDLSILAYMLSYPKHSVNRLSHMRP